jgi:ZIP family zinc transporter
MQINIINGFLLTFLAGAATAVGSAIAFLSGSRGNKLLSFGMGFSAGVMVYVSFVEILPNANKIIGEWFTLIIFFIGIGIAGLIDRLIPDAQNPHQARKKSLIKELKITKLSYKKHKLLRTGFFTALVITIHNFPEGFATFVAASTNLTLGITIAIAVAIHNIPEGISVSVPIYAATGDKKKAFLYSALSGLAEPLGALIGWLVLAPFINESFLGIIMGTIAGIMIYISFDELLPAAHEYGEGHTEIAGVITGMVIMGVSLIIL